MMRVGGVCLDSRRVTGSMRQERTGEMDYLSKSKAGCTNPSGAKHLLLTSGQFGDLSTAETGKPA